MEAQNQEVAALVEKIAGLHAAISKLPSLSPSAEVDALFTDLVTACVPASPVDVAKLGPEAQAMREELIRLCSTGEGHLEAHYADMLAAFDNPLDHLARFPYYGNYMEAQNQEVAALVEKIAGLHAAISKLPSLSPSAEVDALFTDLVTACVPASPVDVAKLGPEAQAMREELIRLCSTGEGHLEAHYADMLAAFDNPLDHLARFPYYGNYVNLSKLEYDLLVRYVPGIAPSRVAFVGSGPLPFSSLVLAAHHLPDAVFDNYDRCGAANERARRLFRGADEGLGARMAFHTADVATLTGELGAYDVVFLAALVGMAAEEKAGVIAHLGAHMADGAALVVRSAHGARGFLYPIVDLEDIRRGGFDVLAVYHPDDEVINSVIVARKADPRRGGGLQNGLTGARGAVPVVSPPCKCCKVEAAAGAFQKAEEFAAKRLPV
uniref:Nicotianamine synthase n=1 Tax=Oryza meridionalis TaxID=40149 RepID=A0A0E0CZI4_9ORYZ